MEMKHYNKNITIKRNESRTRDGEVCVQNIVALFGLGIKF